MSEAQKVIDKLAKDIARHIYNTENFMIPLNKYDKADENELINRLLIIEGIENVIPKDDGLYVYVM